MSTTDDNPVIKIDLTPEQKRQIKQQTGKAAESIKLTIQELEKRVAPKLAANHNETLLTDADD